MAFIVKKKINGNEYFYLRESVRTGNKVKARTIAYLGKDKVEAEKKANLFLKIPEKKDLKVEVVELNNMDKKEMKEEKINVEKKDLTIEELAVFCKRKGFVFKSSEIYGGFSGFWDYGPLGSELFNNIKQDFWKFFVHQKDNMVGIEASIISHPKTWKASGHLASFSDIAVTCKKCKKSTKIDKSELGKVKCECGGEYESQGEFNLMFKTSVGALNPVDAYLRGETAQAMFMDFKLVHETARKQLPFGILQVGRCFRNEIAPRDFIFRLRELTIGEFEFFIHPEEKNCNLLDSEHKNVKLRLLDAETQVKGKDILKDFTIGEMVKENKLDEWHAYWLAEQVLWFKRLGLEKEIKIREHMKDELSHYSSATFDLDYEYPFGSKEVGGNANRGQYDLGQHAKESGANFEIFDEKSKKMILPKVIEPTFGMDRVFLAMLCKAYHKDAKRENIVLRLPARYAPVKAAVFPIIKSEEYELIAEKIVKDLREEWNVNYDKSGSIGKRYARNDEIGTPMCITIDEETLKDESVTIRDRDTTQQVRVKIKDLKEIMWKVVNEGKNVLDFGKKVETRVKEK
ncbi:MAG: glycine--tRNA ligase [Nanoarchaeota archaeon]|nr:glycine--tRNA ligase [Nanoarchaeota archaeon]